MNKITIKDLKSKHKYKEIRETIEKQTEKSFDDKRVLAEAYYKDLELHRKKSFPKAIDILESIDLDKDDHPSETLCLFGAIYKRKWEYEKNLKYLYLSIDKYTQSYENYDPNDMYYGAINTSFLYDVLADGQPNHISYQYNQNKYKNHRYTNGQK